LTVNRDKMKNRWKELNCIQKNQSNIYQDWSRTLKRRKWSS